MMYRFSLFLLQLFVHILFKIQYFGRENIPQPPYIIVPNHVSIIDPPLVGVALKKYPVDFMAKSELFDMPILGAWTRSVNCIYVNRKGGGANSLKEALKRIERGRVICIFPEGTRSADGNLQEAKRGVGFLIAKANVPVVPVYISGSGDAWRKGEGIKLGARIKVYIGKPIFPDDFSLADEFGRKNYESIVNIVMERISRLKTVETSGEKG